MLKKMNAILNIIIILLIGFFAGHGIYAFYHNRTPPDLYAKQTAPWNTGIIVYGIITILVLTAAFGMKLIIRRKLKGR